MGVCEGKVCSCGAVAGSIAKRDQEDWETVSRPDADLFHVCHAKQLLTHPINTANQHEEWSTRITQLPKSYLTPLLYREFSPIYIYMYLDDHSHHETAYRSFTLKVVLPMTDTPEQLRYQTH